MAGAQGSASLSGTRGFSVTLGQTLKEKASHRPSSPMSQGPSVSTLRVVTSLHWWLPLRKPALPYLQDALGPNQEATFSTIPNFPGHSPELVALKPGPRDPESRELQTLCP